MATKMTDEEKARKVKERKEFQKAAKDNVLKEIEGNRPSPEHRKTIEDYWNGPEMDVYRLQEKVLNEIFAAYGDNRDRRCVSFKVGLVDKYYSANLKEGFDDMVENISGYENFNDDVIKGDLGVVYEIMHVRSNVAKSKTKDCMSFASKYCSRIAPDKYPIYDKYVKYMLCSINDGFRFMGEESLNKKSLDTSYGYYTKVLDMFDEYFFEGKLSYKELDRYLWTWAKKLKNDNHVINFG